jgi:hypothetical protein
MISLSELNKLYANKHVRIEGGTSDEGICVEVVQWPNSKHVDFILSNGIRSGLIPLEATPTRCIGRVEVLRTFERTVTVIR